MARLIVIFFQSVVQNHLKTKVKECVLHCLNFEVKIVNVLFIYLKELLQDCHKMSDTAHMTESI